MGADQRSHVPVNAAILRYDRWASPISTAGNARGRHGRPRPARHQEDAPPTPLTQGNLARLPDHCQSRCG